MKITDAGKSAAGCAIKTAIGKYAATAAGIAVLMIIYAHIGCPVFFITGYPCPGCGMTRAWMALLHGAFTEAFRWHPLFWTAPLLVILIRLQQKCFFPRITTCVLCGMALLFLAVYAVRLYALFPNQPPMVYNTNAIIYRLSHWP